MLFITQTIISKMFLRTIILPVDLFWKKEKQLPCPLNVNECLVILCGNHPSLTPSFWSEVVFMPPLFQLGACDSLVHFIFPATMIHQWWAWSAIRAKEMWLEGICRDHWGLQYCLRHWIQTYLKLTLPWTCHPWGKWIPFYNVIHLHICSLLSVILSHMNLYRRVVRKISQKM